VRVVDRQADRIFYHLNLLGVVVSQDRCQLIAKSVEGSWEPIGPSRPLPIRLPQTLGEAEPDALLLTVYQYDRERPGSDLRGVLDQTIDFRTALHGR
jgi:hypothetical protein